MDLPLRALPMAEQWECRGHGMCCPQTIITLREEEIERIRNQRWDEDPEYRGVKIFVRLGLFSGRYRLAQRSDGCCVFFTPEKRCRIHERFGMEGKPLLCRLFPLQVVPLGDHARVTLRRFCPAAAADDGLPVTGYVPEMETLICGTEFAPQAGPPPSIVPGHRRPWREFLRGADVLERLMRDERYPPVRRLVHGLEFCRLLEQSRLRRLEKTRFAELLSLLEGAVVQEASVWFQSRREVGGWPHRLFRQTAMEYLRLHPRLVPDRSWRERFRLLFAALAFGRGRGNVPTYGLPFPAATFADLERPLGPLEHEVMQPIARYFETNAASLRYAILDRSHWALTESFRAMALSYVVAMWTLRLACGERPPTRDDAMQIVMMLDRALGYASFSGRRHRMRVNAITRHDNLTRLVAWYAR